MFSNVRWRIALWFIGLSTAAYIIPTGLALVMFYISLTAAIDRELEGFIGSFGHAITVEAGKPVLRDWARVVQTNPAHSVIAYQLFDENGHLLEAHYPPGIPILFKIAHEVSANGKTMRTRATKLKEGQRVIGYLQVQLPTRTRDDTLRELALITAIVAPVVLLGLGWTSYLVSEKATAQIRQTLALLRQFIADVSHELYTPLSIVQATNESLARLMAPTGMGAKEFQITESTLERMENMLEDLLLLSTMETPRVNDVRQIVELSGLLEETIEEFRPKFVQKGLGLSLIVDRDARTRGDLPALQRMFANIIENACRYTDQAGNVHVELARTGHNVRIVVSDTGIGISKESLPKIFDRFYRVDASRSRSSGGTGLGLAIALAIAQAHGGSIQAESELGRGSTFRVILPLAP